MNTLRAVNLVSWFLFAIFTTAVYAEDAPNPYGKAKADMHAMKATNVVFDVNYEKPESLNILYNFILNTQKVTRGKVVVVTHGPELRAFARENYEKYQPIIDKLASLAEAGVEFKMCNNAMRAAGFQADDMHGFVTIVPAGFPELAYWQSKGYEYINPIPLSVRDVRYLDQPQLKKP
ncbi:DsrE family protein [Sulfuriflexus sp.]|uniref:DsrE family protein n=1 Tax=Sulfuriflexus sp. TaxID=2015443 RepID=UPI0028CD7E8D|nr:DsrE family protein [Sulfuriflexus sp.]MDT8405391.1 DsrE family protein [Sulfuriflexus sp.]